MSFRLPKLRGEVDALLKKVHEGIDNLPKPPSADPLSETLHLISEFARDLERNVEGVPGENELIHKISLEQEAFKKEILALAPDFRPYKRTEARSNETPNLAFLVDENIESLPNAAREPIYLDEVMARAEKCA